MVERLLEGGACDTDGDVGDHRARQAQQLVAEGRVKGTGRDEHIALRHEDIVEEQLALGIVPHAEHVGRRCV